MCTCLHVLSTDKTRTESLLKIDFSMTMISEKLIESIKLHEGFRSTAYRCTSDVLTIGYGRAIDPELDGVGITEAEAEMMLENDLIRFQRAAENVLGDTWNGLNDVRREAMIEMAFNMGPGNLAKFKNMLAALADEDFETASAEALSSRWATQVGKRADRIAERLRTGVYA